MSKIVVINGSPHKQGCTAALLAKISKGINKRGGEVKSFFLSRMTIQNCQGCYFCQRQCCCVLKDDMQELYEHIHFSQGVVLATPVYMWQMTAQLKLIIDRFHPFIRPDYSSNLPPGKKVLLAVTQGIEDTSLYREYFDHVGKSLLFLGFAAYKTLIAGGTHKPEDLAKQTEVLAEARKLGNWLCQPFL